MPPNRLGYSPAFCCCRWCCLCGVVWCRRRVRDKRFTLLKNVPFLRFLSDEEKMAIINNEKACQVCCRRTLTLTLFVSPCLGLFVVLWFYDTHLTLVKFLFCFAKLRSTLCMSLLQANQAVDGHESGPAAVTSSFRDDGR